MRSDDFLTEVLNIIMGCDDFIEHGMVYKEDRKMEENKSSKGGIGMSSPWVTYVNELKVMFRKDPEVRIQYNNDKPEVKVFIDNKRKYEALRKLLPESKVFGGVSLKITLVPANIETTKEQTIRAAFEGNPAFSQVITVDGVYDNPLTYVMFEKEAVQYWNDNMGDPHGMITTLYQDIAERLFNPIDGVMYSTESDARTSV